MAGLYCVTARPGNWAIRLTVSTFCVARIERNLLACESGIEKTETHVLALELSFYFSVTLYHQSSHCRSCCCCRRRRCCSFCFPAGLLPPRLSDRFVTRGVKAKGTVAVLVGTRAQHGWHERRAVRGTDRVLGAYTPLIPSTAGDRARTGGSDNILSCHLLRKSGEPILGRRIGMRQGLIETRNT